MEDAKKSKNLVWILILIILLAVSFIVYEKVLSVDKEDTLEPVVDEEVIDELEEKVEEAKEEEEEDEEVDDEEVKELEEKIERLEDAVADLEEENEDLEEAVAEETEEEEAVAEETEEEEAVAEEIEEEEEAVAYEGENFITLTSPNDGAGFCVQPVEFAGEVSPNTGKIVVTAFAESGLWAGIDDTYTLQGFEIGDDEFIYRAKEEWDNLSYGGPKYTFTAHFDDGSTQSIERSIVFGTDDTSCGSHDGINITLSSPANGSSFDITSSMPIVFTGSTSKNTTKVVVTATGGDPTCDPDIELCHIYMEDIYTLQDFEHGDDSFIYRAKPEWDNLTAGENTYTFTAHFDDGSTESITIIINYNIPVG